MRRLRLAGFVTWQCVAGVFFSAGASVFGEEPKLKFDGKNTFEASSLPKDALQVIEARLANRLFLTPLSVHLVDASGKPSKTSLSGTTTVESGVLRFRPGFPLEAGQTYMAVLRSREVDGSTGLGITLTRSFSIPKKARGAATTITAVYPTQDVLPENQLKFYLHFSAPMSRGEAYNHVHLLNEKGEAIDLPFLELEQELWDARQQRLTLLFDPGRIKRGLKPREEVGPVLEEGKRYTFVVDADWPDADGVPLAKGIRKAFRAGPPDDQPIALAKWKVTAPNGPGGLSIQFPEALDHALAERLIWVETAKGERFPGVAHLEDHEHRWTFLSMFGGPWKAGDYRIAVDASVEDLAGNTVGKPFEIDVLRPVEKKVEQKIHYLPFAVR